MEPSDKKSAKTARLPPEGSGQTPARETLALDKLVTDAGTQVRAEISEYIVGEYVDALGEGARFPPVVVFRGKGADVLGDGFHRVRAYLLRSTLLRRRLSRLLVLPAAPAALRLRYVTPNPYRAERHQRLVAVVPLVGDHLFNPRTVRLHQLHLLGRHDLSNTG